MKIVETYSHLNGLEFLLVHKPGLWDEIQQVVTAVDGAACKTKIPKGKRTQGQVFFSPVKMNRTFKNLLGDKNWQESRVSYWVTGDARLIRKTLPMPPEEQKREIEAAGAAAIYSYNQTDFVKHLAFYIGDQIDVGIEILPMKSLQSQMSSGVSYYEGELYNVVRQGRACRPCLWYW
mgnify:CR=1 FL=1